MSTINILNSQIAIIISDPWEFGTECGTGPFIGTISDVTNEMLIIKLLTPINYSGKNLQTAIGKSRHAGNSIDTIITKAMPANMLLLDSSIKLASEIQPNIKQEGIAVIGTIERLSKITK